MEAVNVQLPTRRWCFILSTINLTGGFDSGSTAVDIYDAVNGAQVFIKDNRDKLHMFDPD